MKYRVAISSAHVRQQIIYVVPLWSSRNSSLVFSFLYSSQTFPNLSIRIFREALFTRERVVANIIHKSRQSVPRIHATATSAVRFTRNIRCYYIHVLTTVTYHLCASSLVTFYQFFLITFIIFILLNHQHTINVLKFVK